MTHTFAVDLRGLIDLLSEHLYGGPEVYVRELLQNGVDALKAREALGPRDDAALTFTLGTHEGVPTLTFRDTGVGLTEAEVHSFLATIGKSSKRGQADFIGQFGIGLLSCFVVSDQIELVSRSAHGGPAVRWEGRSDGTYSLSPAPGDTPVGTCVQLRAKPGREEYFDYAALLGWVRQYGALLPCPVRVQDASHDVLANQDGAPWRQTYPTPELRREALLHYGEEIIGTTPLDVIDLSSAAGQLDGVAFVLPWTPSQNARGQHRIYLRNMLIGDEKSELVPDWAFFVRAVLNSGSLRPNAARDALHQDEAHAQASLGIGEALRAYLLNLQREHPQRLRQLISLHYLSIKALAAEDDAFFELFVPWLPFETSFGRLTLPEFLERAPEVRYVGDLNLFRQVAQIEGVQGRGVVHAVYTYDEDLLRRYARLHPEVEVRRLDAQELSRDLGGLNAAEQAQVRPLLEAARAALEGHGVRVQVGRFQPAELASLYLPHDNFARTLSRTRETLGDGLWGGLLGDLNAEYDVPQPELHLNLNNPLVLRAATLPDGPVLRRVVGMLYVQALLLGHHPMTGRELRLLNEGMIELIAWTLEANAGAGAGSALNLN